MVGDALNLIHEVIEIEEFIIGESWASILAQNITHLIFEDDESCEPAKLKANYVDAHYGTLADLQAQINNMFA